MIEQRIVSMMAADATIAGRGGTANLAGGAASGDGIAEPGLPAAGLTQSIRWQAGRAGGR